MQTILDAERTTERGKVEVAQDVIVNVTPAFGDGTVCEIEAGNGPSHAFVHGGIINLRGNPSFQVTWSLQPGNSPSLQFDCSNPIWSSQAGCPGSVSQDPQISIVNCTGTTLVTNIDPAPPSNAVHVSLGFTNGNRFDPIIINN